MITAVEIFDFCRTLNVVVEGDSVWPLHRPYPARMCTNLSGACTGAFNDERLHTKSFQRNEMDQRPKGEEDQVLGPASEIHRVRQHYESTKGQSTSRSHGRARPHMGTGGSQGQAQPQVLKAS